MHVQEVEMPWNVFWNMAALLDEFTDDYEE